MATKEGLIPVIPVFDYQDVTYPVDSPTGLTGRAVAALYGYPPGCHHAWMPEEATEHELEKFSYRPSYGPILFQRWKVNAALLPPHWDLSGIPDVEKYLRFERNSRRDLYSHLSPWKKVQYLELICKNEEEAKIILDQYLTFASGIFSRLSVPLVERVEIFVKEVKINYSDGNARAIESFIIEMNLWTFANRGIVIWVPPVIAEEVLISLLPHTSWDQFITLHEESIKVGEPWSEPAWAKIKFTHDCLFGNTMFRGPLGPLHEALLLQNLKDRKRTLNSNLISWMLFMAEEVGPGHLLVALHDPGKQKILLRKSPTKPISAQIREYLLRNSSILPVEDLLRFGFYGFNSFDFDVILPILSQQESYLIEADRAGFFALCARMLPMISDNHDLKGAPWPLLRLLAQLGHIKATIELSSIPDHVLTSEFKAEFKH